LTLDDEPTLVRAVKAVKRTMARDERLKRGYMALAVSTAASLLMGVGVWLGGLRVGVVSGLVMLGGGFVYLRSIALGGAILMMAWIFGLPMTGIMVPYHPVLLHIYHPTVQSCLQLLGVVGVVSVLVRDIVRVVILRRERAEKRKKEELDRQQKLKGIFYTPAKQQRSVRGASSGFAAKGTFDKKDPEFRKSKSMFTLS